MKRLLRLDWDAVAGIAAAVVALILHFLHIVEAEILSAMVLVLLALLLLRDLRREHEQGSLTEHIERTEAVLGKIQMALTPPDAVLIGPSQLRSESARFGRRLSGETLWFNVCLLMFKPQPLFDVLLRPAIENSRVTTIQFILSEDEKERWSEDVMPKVQACPGREKVMQPIWTALPESVSFIMGETEPDGKTEALLSFWGEPFMARSTERNVPRYLFHVQHHSELVTRLAELARTHRFGK